MRSSDNELRPVKPPMSDMEFHNYLDNAGHMVRPNEFRLSIYQGGIEASLRRVAWRHLLNIYPADMSANERYTYMKRKEEEYRRLREEWRVRFKNNTATEEVKYVASMVKKDVLRTDRGHAFYKGSGDTDDNENTLALFHLLVTYALTHPDVSYCQGMSDLASPILLTQKDEGQAYICFCALMQRLRENFTVEGNAIMNKFKHLTDLLSMYDPILLHYLQQNSAGDMFFCYRWFLLEMKREFPFSDALYVMEVMWATLPPSPPRQEIPLVDPDYSARLLSSSPCSPTFSVQQAMYAKLLAMRRVGALHRIAQASKPAAPDSLAKQHEVQPAGSNSIKSPSHLDISNNATASTAFDVSPGDIDDKVSDFPQVDDILTRSLQIKSSSIDQVLQESPKSLENVDTDLDQNILNSDTADFDENGMDNSKTTCTKRIPIKNMDSVIDNNDCGYGSSGVHNNGGEFLEDLVNRSEHSLSVSSAQSLEDSEQVQFELSIEASLNASTDTMNNRDDDNDRNSSGNVSDGSEPKNRNITYLQTEPTNAIDSDNRSEMNSNSGIFSSMKRLLASPIRRSTDLMPSSPTSSPKRNVPLRQVNSTPGAMHASPMIRDYTTPRPPDSTESVETCVNHVEAQSSPSKSKPTIMLRDPSLLPPPQEFGGGNPFLMFLCLTIITMHRDVLIRNEMCYEEIAMHFDRLVRRHNCHRVLYHARQFYTEYLKAQQANVDRQREKEIDALDKSGMSC